MYRRSFVAAGLSLCLWSGAGCLDDNGDEDDDGLQTGTSPYREVHVEAAGLMRERDALIVEDGDVLVTLQLENVGFEPTYAEITVQMRDHEGAPIGSPYSQTHGPIDPGGSVFARFEIDDGPGEVAGYEIVVTETDP